MQLLSVNVSKPKLRRYRWKFYSSAFQKKPVHGSVQVKQDNLAGDKQADLMNHGGNNKAVYGFSTDHHTHWKQQLGIDHIDYGKFGENLSISGLDEAELAIGDQLQINDCVLEVSQPRIPCYKISFEFQHIPMLNEFIAYAHTGVYFRVITTGSIQAGDEVTVIKKHPANVTIINLFRAYLDSKFPDQEAVMRQAVALPELADEWRAKMNDRLHLIDLYHERQKNK